MFRFRPVNNAVIYPSSTGSDSNNSRAVMGTDHTNSGICSGFMLIVTDIKFTVPTAAGCREKTARSVDTPVCASPLAWADCSACSCTAFYSSIRKKCSKTNSRS